MPDGQSIARAQQRVVAASAICSRGASSRHHDDAERIEGLSLAVASMVIKEVSSSSMRQANMYWSDPPSCSMKGRRVSRPDSPSLCLLVDAQ